MHLCNIIKKVKEVNIYHPVSIVILGHLALIILALPFICKLGFINLTKIILILSLFIFFFSLPFLFKEYFKFKNNRFILLLSYTFLVAFSFYGAYKVTNSIALSIAYVIFILIILEIFCKFYKNKYFTDFLFFLGILSFLLIIIKYGGIPLFDYKIRMAINLEPLRLIAMGSLIYGGIEKRSYFLIAFILLSLLGYKAGIVMLIFSYLVYKRIDIKKALIIFLSLILFLSVISQVILLSSSQTWKYKFLTLLSYRAYFDLMVFSKIINSNLITYGSIIFIPNGEAKVGELLFNYSHNFTTTLFGTVYMDFNLIGLLFSLFLGIVSKYLYEGDWKLYSIYASLLLAYCDIGINYGFLVVLFLLMCANAKIKMRELK
ncbi:oligosaccharide repeat unit polymerase [Methanocaldococcus infernus]